MAYQVLLIFSLLDSFFCSCSEYLFITNSAIICFGILGFSFALNKIINLDKLHGDDIAYKKIYLEEWLEKKNEKIRMKLLNILSLSMLCLIFLILSIFLRHIPILPTFLVLLSVLLTLHLLGESFQVISQFKQILGRWKSVRRRESEFGELEVESFKRIVGAEELKKIPKP